MEKTQQSTEHGTLSENMKSAIHEKRSLAVVSMRVVVVEGHQADSAPNQGPGFHHLGNEGCFFPNNVGEKGVLQK